ncbi:hypothetical protein WN48_04845 [Eufriesea mexicana]|uniref:Uncharacterized protein n=1 Tax=Eufriesea mexicana TaxID=516756 RepID=A0A310SKY3_9HYME|nr:hypothetical protein WN48_04845 [Eufriesea mexicana]
MLASGLRQEFRERPGEPSTIQVLRTREDFGCKDQDFRLEVNGKLRECEILWSLDDDVESTVRSRKENERCEQRRTDEAISRDKRLPGDERVEMDRVWRLWLNLWQSVKVLKFPQTNFSATPGQCTAAKETRPSRPRFSIGQINSPESDENFNGAS